MASQRPLSDLTAEELMDLALEYRGMASTATTAQIRDTLLRLAGEFETLSAARDANNRR
jgi:hypothetical protein